MVDNDDGCITVNHTVYQQYLDNGGTADALIGRCLANDNINDSKRVLNNTLEYIKIVNQHNALSDAAYRKQVLVTTKNALREWCSNHVKAMATHDGMDKGYVLKMAYHHINELHHHNIEDGYHCAKHIVAKSIYCFTNAYAYLSYMDEALKHNDKLTSEECSTVATLELMCDYAANQLYLEEY